MPEPCLDCGEFELVYVPHCNDPDVGSGVILMFAYNLLNDLEEEIGLVEEKFKAVWDAPLAGNVNGGAPNNPEIVIQKKDELAEFLGDHLNFKEVNPMKHLTGIQKLYGDRWTYVRSDKLKNHVRSYSIEDRDVLANVSKSAYVDGNGREIKQLDKSSALEEFRKVKDKISDDVRQGIRHPSLELEIKGGKSWGLSDLFDSSFTRWIDDINKSLKYSDSFLGDRIQINAAMQVAQAYGGARAFAGYDPDKNVYGAGGTLRAGVSLVEAKAELSGFVPHQDGWHAFIPYDDSLSASASDSTNREGIDFGYFRFEFTLAGSASAGASIMGTAGIEYSEDGNLQTIARGTTANGKGEVSAAAFAGVQAGVAVTGKVEWDNPDERAGTSKHGWQAIFEVGTSVKGQLGASAGFTLQLAISDDGKIIGRAKAAACLGIGGSGEVTFVVGAGTILNFGIYIFRELIKADFSRIEWLNSIFDHLVKIQMYMIENAVDTIEDFGVFVKKHSEYVINDFKGAKESREYAEHIRANLDLVRFATPEVKAKVLYRLSQTYWSSHETEQERAILDVMNTCQTYREWLQIEERIASDGGDKDPGTGLVRLRKILDDGWFGHENREASMDKIIGKLVSRVCGPEDPCQLYANVVDEILGIAYA